MKPRLLWLVVAIPVASVLFGAMMFYVATSSPDFEVDVESEALNKTSWQSAPAEQTP